MSAPFSGSLHIVGAGKDGRIACRRCDHPLAAPGEPWKAAAAMKELPMNGAGGSAYQSGEHVVLRQFYCPECGTLLDSETAMSGDPALNDVFGG